MAKVITAPKNIERPEYKGDWKAYQADEERFVEDVKQLAREKGNGQYKGEEVRFQCADGYARYVVFSVSPPILIHLETGDKWHAPIANYITAKGIKEEIERSKGLAALFAEHRKRQGFDKPKQ